jgi:hypothetical protein
MAAREHKLLEGEGVGKYLPFARQKAELLYRQARGGTRTQRWLLDGEFEVAIRVVGEDKYIRITGGCPKFLSGLVDAVLEPGALIEDGPKPIYTIPDPNNPAQTIKVLRRFYSKKGAAWKDERGLNTSGKDIVQIRSSMFSGEMRKVVQVLQGMNQTVSYSPTWYKTHGVFTAQDKSKWVIEVSSSGVVAYPMNVCSTAIEGLGYTPLPTTKPAGGYITLLTADQVKDAYSKVPFFPACGWAFNPGGHKAINVAVTNDDDKTKTTLYRLTITEVENRPASATLVEADSGFIHGPKWVHMKFPDIDGVLFSFDTSNGSSVFTTVCDAPVFAYYDGDTEVVAQYLYTPGTRSTNASDPLISSV